MTLLEQRDTHLSDRLFPRASPQGDEDQSAVLTINGVHFNTTALQQWNYTYYPDNRTISNASRCYLAFDRFRPAMLANGSWVNGTSCYMPINGIRARGALGIGFATLFALSIVFTLVNLRKHGRRHIREDRRFRVVGRRWQWYWMSFTAACGIVSSITAIDVDRDYLQDMAIVLQSFFYCLMTPGTLAMVWETTRHWGSWQERQLTDVDQFAFKPDDRRAKVEFWLPLIFYFFTWLNFFLVIPRPWNPLKKQNSTEQQAEIAQLAGTDVRFKAGALVVVVALAVICISLDHSLKHYKPRSRGLSNKLNSFALHCPAKLFFAIVALALRTAYGIAMAWRWNVSLFKYDVDVAWPYGLGYAPVIIIIVILNVAGHFEENEDKQLLSQRRTRGMALDRELGITKKPHWWYWGRTEFLMTPEQRMRALTTEVDPSPRHGWHEGSDIELANGNGVRGRSRNKRSKESLPDDHSPASKQPLVFGGYVAEDKPEIRRRETDNASTTTDSTGLSGMTLGRAPNSQKIRSMLDV